MSLKAFKESLDFYNARSSVRRFTPVSPSKARQQRDPEIEPAVIRQPLRTSLREQFAVFDGFPEPRLPSVCSASPAQINSLPPPALRNIDQPIAVKCQAASAETLGLGCKRPLSHGMRLQKCKVEVTMAKEDFAEAEDWFSHVPKRRKVETNHIEETTAAEEYQAVSDSEAGLFLQLEKEGLYEPLVLWPPSGEGSSSGVEDGRVVQVPASINSRLLPHQREGVKFLYNLYREGRGGILGDDMGLGKTIQTISFIAALLPRDGEARTIRSLRLFPDSGGDEDVVPSHKLFLILCPTSVLHNWEQEFQAWGSFKVGIYHGVNRDAIMKKVQADELEVLLTSHDMFRLNVTTICAIKWDCVIVDEAHRLKNEKSQLYKACDQIKTRRRYGLTGTIMQNKYIELFNVFDWAAPRCLGPREHFLEYYGEPLKQGQRISAPERFVRIAEERKQHLVKVLGRHLLRRTKQETIGHLLRGKADNVVFCKMSDLQTRAYRRLLRSPDFQLLISKDLPCSCGSHLTRVDCCHRTAPDGVIWSYLHRDNPDGCEWCPFCVVLPCLTKLQQVSNHLELIKPSSKDDPEKQIKDEQFASAALGEDAVLVGGLQQDESFMKMSDAQHCGKMRALEKLLETWLSKGDKVLLFSCSVKMLDILDRFLVRKAYSFCRLDGSTPMGVRQTLVDDFNNSSSKQVFLISTRAGGLGLNLVSANRVVIFDPNWNPAQDLQAQDRSFRYGQRRHVTVYRLLAAGSIEELVYSRQIYKQQLFNIGVNGTLEKRYFEGVQDSKLYKGELFGISNLFQDLSETVFTSEIIEKHEERLTGIQCASSKQCSIPGLLSEHAVSNKVEVKNIENNESSAISEEQDGIEDEIESPNDTQSCSESQYEHILKDAGVLYAHRNEKVVNLGGGVQKLKRSKTKENTCLMNDTKTSIRLVVNDHQRLTASSNLKILSENSEEGGPYTVGQKTKQCEEISTSEEMDEITKWFLSGSSLYPTRSVNY